MTTPETAPSPFSSPGKQFAWDSTSLKYAEVCPHKYYLKMIERWQPRRKNENLLFGGWYASALEHYHQHRAAGAAHDEAQSEIVEEALAATWFREGNVAGHPEGPWESGHRTKTRETLIRSIVWYTEEFAEDQMKTALNSKGAPLVEQSFRLEMPGGFLYCGHLDRVVEYTSLTLVQDQKTTASTPGPYYMEQYSMDTQMAGYTWAGSVILDSPINGVCIDAAQIAVGFTAFSRGFVHYPPDLLDEWWKDSQQLIARMHQYADENYWPRNRSSCNNYGGCEFRGVCNKIPSLRKQFLKADFVQAPLWNPLETR